MHPEIQQHEAGSCAKCGMALEPMTASAVTTTKTEYTCPMHPEIRQQHPGNCPKCGMALEAVTVSVEEKNEELIDMSRRFWISTVLAFPVFVLAMLADMLPAWLPGMPQHADGAMDRVCPGHACGAVGRLAIFCSRLAVYPELEPQHVHPDRARRRRRLVIQRGGLVAAADLSRQHAECEDGLVAVYFEAAAVITALVLLGQVLELRARSRTNAAIQLLLGLGPKTTRIVRE